jgi:uncharacterized membrane protein
MFTLDDVRFALTLVAALGCGLMAGVFFAFSTSVMKALSRVQPACGIAAMQSINITIVNRWFLSVFFGTAAACLALAAWSLLRWHAPGATYLLTGGLLYPLGTVILTMVYHVPRNNGLAGVDPMGPEGAALWSRYVPAWVAGNHVRTVAALASAALLTLALRHS